MDIYSRVRSLIPQDKPKAAYSDPSARWDDLAKVARKAADLTGIFSLFALISVLALAAGAKQLPLPLANLFQRDALWFTVYIPWIIPFFVGAVGLFVMNRHWLRMAQALSFKDTPISKTFVILVGVVIAGAVIVLSTKLQDTGKAQDARDNVVATEWLAANKRALEAEKAQVERELADMMTNSNAWLAQAASVGAEEWERSYVAQALEDKDARLPVLKRALGAARAADAKREEIRRLTREIAAAPVAAEVVSEVEYDRGVLAWTTDLFEVVPVWLALSIEAIALVMKFLETVFQRKAWAQQQQAPAPTASTETAEQSKPSADIIILDDWRDQEWERGRTNEAGALTKEVTQRRTAA